MAGGILAAVGVVAGLLFCASEHSSDDAGQASAASAPMGRRHAIKAGRWPATIRQTFLQRQQAVSRQFALTEMNLTPNTTLSNERDPAWSLTDRLAFSSNGADSNADGKIDSLGADYDLWTMDREGSFLRNVAVVVGDQTEPSWSPEGGQLAYISTETGSPQLFTRSLTTGTAIQLTGVPPNPDLSLKKQPFWSPAGDMIYYASKGDRKGTNPDGGWEIFAINVDGKVLRQITNSATADNTNPALSPNSRWLAFTSTRSGSRRIWVMSAAAELESSVPFRFSNPPDATAEEDDPDFSLNGARLAFASNRPTAAADAVPDFNIWTAAFAGVGSVESGAALISNGDVVNSAADTYPTYSRNANPPLLANFTAFTSARTGTDDIWRANAVDTMPPIIEDGFPKDTTDQPFVRVTPRTPREGLFPGGTATIDCVLSDLESGLLQGAQAGSVVVEINDPDFDRGMGLLDPHFSTSTVTANPSVNVTVAYENSYRGNRPFLTDTTDEFALVAKLNMDVWDDGPVSKGGHELPSNAVAGDHYYYCTTTFQTPLAASDYYLDLLCVDLVGNDYEYDNIWGLSTEPFSSVPQILVVSDYLAGQDWADDILPQPGGLSREWEAGVPSESHLTYNPGGDYGAWNDTISGSLGEAYALWRVECRGRVTPDVYTAYLPREEKQVDPANVGTVKTVTVAEKVILWENPYTGSLRVGPGSLINSRVQQDLTSFLNSGGRLVISGQDIGFGLTNNGAEQNTFFSTYLKMGSLSSDIGGRSNPPTTTGANPIANHPYPYWGADIADVLRYPIPPPNQGCWCDCSPNDNWWADSVAAGGGAQVVYGYGAAAGPTAAVLIDNTGGGATAGSRLVYFAFDIAAVHRDYATNPTRCLNHRGKIVHDAVCWARTGFVYGQVKDIETDAPIPNIQVNIGTVASGFTMSDGRYEVHGVPPGTYGITIGTPGYFEHPGAGVAVHGGLSDVENFRLTIAPPGSISGFVFQSDGVTPIGAGVTVTAQPLATDPQGNALPSTSTITAADGSYQIPQVAAGDYDVTANPDGTAIGYNSLTQNSVKVSPGSDTPGINFTLGSQPSAINGQVTNAATTQPIQGASVKAEFQGSALGSAVTDANGNYNMPSLSSGDYVVTASINGYSPASKSLTLKAGEAATVNLQLQPEPPGSISGTITSATTEQPLAGILVRVIDSAGLEIARTTTGASLVTEGAISFNYAFRAPSAPIGSGTYTVEIDGSSQGFGTAQRTATVVSNRETSGVDAALTALRSFAPGLHMFSLPFDFGGTDAAVLLGLGTLKLATWKPTTTAWAFYPNPPADRFSLGRGYFALFSSATDLTRSGAAAPPTLAYPISVFTGWNLIGTPFNFEVDWLATRVRTSAGTEIALQDAQSSGILGTGLFTLPTVLNSSSGFTGYNLATRLTPFGGYWLYATQDATLLVSSTQVRSRAPRQAASPSERVGADGWAIQLVARAGEARDGTNYAGVASRAVDGRDPLDMDDPPPVSFVPYVSLSFVPEPGRADSSRLAVDLRSDVAGEKRWTFEVTTNQADVPVTLSWPELSELPSRYRAYLVDPESGQRKSMRTGVSYTYRGQAGAPRRFQLVITAGATGALRVTGLRQVPSRGAGSLVSFSLSQPANVDFRIVSANGRVVYQRAVGELPAGLTQLRWEGRDRSGQTLSRGVYLVQLVAADSATGDAYRAVGTLVVR